MRAIWEKYLLAVLIVLLVSLTRTASNAQEDEDSLYPSGPATQGDAPCETPSVARPPQKLPRDRHDPTPPPMVEGQSQSIFSSLPEPLISVGVKRNRLRDCYGVVLGSKYIGETLNNNGGGQKTGAIYEGKFRLSLDIDFHRLIGVPGLTFHASGSQLHGRGVAAHNVSAIMPPSNIEGTPSTRLYEAWAQQSLLDDKINVRFGQLGADQEFMYPAWAVIFLNNTFGWASILNANLPAGGPSFPLSSLGVRVKLNPNEHFSFMAAVLDGNPAGPQGLFGNPDPQVRNSNGLLFRLSDPPLLLTEAQVKYKIAEQDGELKLGYWRHYGKFVDQRLGMDFLSLADPNGAGVPLMRRGNHGYYAIIDQKMATGAGPGRGVGFFGRASVAPGDRNLVEFYADMGVSFVGFFASRPDDMFGLAVGYAKISNAAAQLDEEADYFNNTPFAPVRSNEQLLEATYIAHILPGWYLQPDFQYIARPGGHVADPRDLTGTKAVGNSMVFGLRTILRF